MSDEVKTTSEMSEIEYGKYFNKTAETEARAHHKWVNEAKLLVDNETNNPNCPCGKHSICMCSHWIGHHNSYLKCANCYCVKAIF